MFELLEAPASGTGVLRDFCVQKSVEGQKWLADDAVCQARNILQGCPASMLLLAALMAVWTKYVGDMAEHVKFSISVDDRALWARGEDTAERLKRSPTRAATIDGIMGMQVKTEKCDVFDTCLSPRKTVKEALADSLMDKECVHTFNLLRIWYNTTRQHRCHGDNKAINNIIKMADKLRRGTSSMKLVSTAIFTPTPWVGAWSRHTLRDITRVKNAVERCLRGIISERIPA